MKLTNLQLKVLSESIAQELNAKQHNAFLKRKKQAWEKLIGEPKYLKALKEYESIMNILKVPKDHYRRFDQRSLQEFATQHVKLSSKVCSTKVFEALVLKSINSSDLEELKSSVIKMFDK